MTKPKSKGQRVKTFTALIPTPTLKGDEPLKVVVYFRATEGTFHAEVPERIAEAVGRHPEAPDEFRYGEITTRLADRVQPAFAEVCVLYREMQRQALKKKVIQVYVRACYPRPGELPVAFEELSFEQSPALWIRHRVLWQIGDGLYSATESRVDGSVSNFSYMNRAPKPEDYRIGGKRGEFLLDWTPEREEFFQRMHNGLLSLIEHISALLAGDTGRNVDALLAGGSQGFLLAPPPSTSSNEGIR